MLGKKSIVLLALLASSPSAWSLGYYVGVGAGPTASSFKQAATVINPFTNVRDITHLSGYGAFGTIFAGADMRCSCFYIGAEANADISSAKFISSNDEFISNSFSHTNYRIKRVFGLSLLPGYSLSDDTLFYGRLGYANGRFESYTTDVSLASVDRNIGGFRYGLGIRKTLCGNLDMRMEFSGVRYRSTGFTVVTGITTKTTHITPITGQVEFGLVYRFC